MSVTAFNRRRRNIADQAAKREEPAQTQEAMQPASPQAPRRRRKQKTEE